METEKLTLELPKPLVEWYRRIAASEGEDLENILECELAAALAGLMDLEEFIDNLWSADEIRQSGILEVFKKHPERCIQVSWLDYEPAPVISDTVSRALSERRKY